MKSIRRLQRCLCWMLLAALLLSFPAGALAVSTSGTCGKNGSNLKWSLENGVLTISGKGEMKDYDEEDAPWSSYAFTELRVEKGVTSIGKFAFYCCESLTRVTLPDGLTSIGDSAFSDCIMLGHVTLPNSLVSLGEEAFALCFGMGGGVKLPDRVTHLGDNVFWGLMNAYFFVTPGSSAEKCSRNTMNLLYLSGDASGICGEDGGNLKWTLKGGVLTISGKGEMADYDPDDDPAPWRQYLIRELRVEKGVTAVGEGAFSGCVSLTGVSLPNGLTSIGESAFEECTNLKALSLPETLTYVGDFAFYRCVSLEGDVKLPKRLTDIGESAFEECGEACFLAASGSYAEDYCWDNDLDYSVY